MTRPDAPQSVVPIPAFEDNYLWLLVRGAAAVVVDPGDAAAVQRELDARGAALAAILVTHHHGDHTGGVAELAARHRCPVFGPAAEAPRIPALTHPLQEGGHVEIPELGLRFEVWEVPGHTAGHIAFVGAGAAAGLLFCGDTLFSAGCGRLFEGTAGQLHRSLQRLAALPPETAVYCTHEYTASNLAFARAVLPDDGAIAAAIAEISGRRARGEPSLPSTIGRERSINVFLRAGEPGVAAAASAHAGALCAPGLPTFTALRRWKDGFRAPPTKV